MLRVTIMKRLHAVLLFVLDYIAVCIILRCLLPNGV